MNARYCAECGTALGGGRYCPACGTPAASGGENGPEGNAGAHRPIRPRSRFVVVGAAIVAVVVIVAVAVALAESRKGRADSAPSTTARATTTTVAPITATTESPAQKAHDKQVAAALAAAATARADYKAFVTSMETIVTQSTQGRSDLGVVLSEVENGCATTPALVLGEINDVVANRTSVLNQLAGLAVPASNTEAVQLKSLLQMALQSSINADNYYAEWMQNLTNDYAIGGTYSYCPGGAPTSYPAFDQARGADSQSTQAKQNFVAAFNPVASNLNLQTWSPTQF
jgi:hypothetical protein